MRSAFRLVDLRLGSRKLSHLRRTRTAPHTAIHSWSVTVAKASALSPPVRRRQSGAAITRHRWAQPRPGRLQYGVHRSLMSLRDKPLNS